MVIDKDCWHARLYRWWRVQKHYGDPTSVNLCPYVRAVLFWAPLRFLFLHRVMRWISCPILAGAVEYVAWRFGGHKFLEAEGVVLMAIFVGACLVAIVAGVFWTIEKTKSSDPVRSFGRVLAHRYENVHKGICPIVHIR